MLRDSKMSRIIGLCSKIAMRVFSAQLFRGTPLHWRIGMTYRMFTLLSAPQILSTLLQTSPKST
jgi:hypothetical protein